jgi:N-carbamoyl-L-amino-acid hydrolase
VLAINEIARRSPGNTIATVGSLSVFPNLSSVIPGKVNLVIDFRESKTEAMTHLQNEIISRVNQIAEENNLKSKTEIKSFTKPALPSTRIMEAISSSTESLGLSKKRMRSGAGHDCQLMAGITEVGMIFVPSHEGVSHAPSEFTRPEDLENGANVLLNAILRLAN